MAAGEAVTGTAAGTPSDDRAAAGAFAQRLDRIGPGGPLELPGRGTTWVRDIAGPPGAPVLILLHGLTATADLNWFTSYQALSRRCRVVALDHRGHGRGIRTRRRFRLADCADDVVAVADRLGIDRFVAVGYSMGGPIAQLTWHRHRERVSGLVLCATSRNFRGRPRERLMFGFLGGAIPIARLSRGWLRSRVAERIVAGRVDENDELAAWLRDQFRRGDPAKILEAAAALGRFSSHHWIEHVDVPTAVVVTTQDRLVPPHRQRKLLAAVPGAVEVPVAGDHSVCVSNPGAFVPALARACAVVTDR